jgi:GntR family transcriptional regulator, transcriptional repressor for pyruvate dehydrogenase complex
MPGAGNPSTSIWGAMPPALTPTTPRIIAEVIRGFIHRGELISGDRLPPERVLADQLGVARVSLRDALAQLQQEGYLLARRGAHGGTFVTGLAEPRRRWVRRMQENPAALEDIIDYRIAIEAHAAWLAARRRHQADLPAIEEAIGWRPGAVGGRSFRAADSAFHRAIAIAARSPRLEAAIDEARGLLFLPADALVYPPGTDRSLGDHRWIAAAVRDGDGDRAAAAMRAHIESTRDSLRHALITPDGTRPAPSGRRSAPGGTRSAPAARAWPRPTA